MPLRMGAPGRGMDGSSAASRSHDPPRGDGADVVDLMTVSGREGWYGETLTPGGRALKPQNGRTSSYRSPFFLDSTLRHGPDADRTDAPHRVCWALPASCVPRFRCSQEVRPAASLTTEWTIIRRGCHRRSVPWLTIGTNPRAHSGTSVRVRLSTKAESRQPFPIPESS
jgi:hypothetical protein